MQDWDAIVEQVVVKETVDLLRIWGQDPEFIRKYYPNLVLQGNVTWSTVRAYMEPLVRRRYVDGRCSLCGGEAVKCAPRHGIGRSCF